MALTRITSDGITDGTITGTDLTTNIDLVDNQKLRLGNSQNLQIYYDASSYITNSTAGHLIIKTTNGGSDINLECADDFFVKTGVTQNSIIARDSGQVELYYSGSKKFETESFGATLTGNLDVTSGDIKLLADNKSIQFGAGADLLIYHDGSHSRIYNSTGNLTVRSAVFDVLNADGSERMFKATADAGCELFFNGNAKVQTRTGDTLFLDDVRIQDNNKINIGTGDDLQIYHDGSFNFIRSENGHPVNIIKSTTENIAKFIPDGAVELYYDNALKFQTVSGGVRTNGNLELLDAHEIQMGNSTDFQIFHGGTNSHIVNSTNELKIRSNDVRLQNAAGNENYFVGFANSYAAMYYDNSKKFETTSTGTSTTGKAKVNGGTTTRCIDGLNTHSSGGELASFQNEASNHYGGLVISGGEIDRECRMEAAWGSGFFTFWTDNAERMRIDSSGRAGIGSNVALNSAMLSLAQDNTHLTCRSFATGGYDSIIFRSANTTVGKVFFNSGGTQYHTSSDYRRKENVITLTGAIDRVKTLLPKRFNFITEPSVTRDGFLAHEVTAVPEAIQGTKDQVATEKDVEDGKADSIGDPIYQTIDQSTLVPLLTAALQEAIAKIETLETKVAALEAG